MPAALSAQLLAADAVRMEALDHAAAERRLFEAESVATGTLAFGEVALTRARSRLRHETDPELLREQAQVLSDYSELGGAFAPAMIRIAGAIGRSTDLADSVAPGEPFGDMKLFLAAEIARDSAEFPNFAAQLFRRTALRGLSQCPTSFFGTWRQGIHRKLLVA